MHVSRRWFEGPEQIPVRSVVLMLVVSSPVGWSLKRRCRRGWPLAVGDGGSRCRQPGRAKPAGSLAGAEERRKRRSRQPHRFFFLTLYYLKNCSPCRPAASQTGALRKTRGPCSVAPPDSKRTLGGILVFEISYSESKKGEQDSNMWPFHVD